MKLLETIKALDGELFHLEYHQRRLEQSLQKLGFCNSLDLSALLSPPKEGLIRCRVIYDENAAEVTYHPYTPRTFQALQLVIADELDYALKYADRTALTSLFEQRGSADDVLIVKDSLITDTTVANIAFYENGRWITPAQPLLHGTTRARLLDEGLLTEADIAVTQLERFEKYALMNAMIGFMEIENGIISPKQG